MEKVEDGIWPWMGAAFRQKYEIELMQERDVQSFVGTLNAHPPEWIIVGLFYLPKFAPRPLFGE